MRPWPCGSELQWGAVLPKEPWEFQSPCLRYLKGNAGTFGATVYSTAKGGWVRIVDHHHHEVLWIVISQHITKNDETHYRKEVDLLTTWPRLLLTSREVTPNTHHDVGTVTWFANEKWEMSYLAYYCFIGILWYTRDIYRQISLTIAALTRLA